MKIYRPLWEDGAALAPQQFQQQARWNERVADMVARMGISHPWGVVAAEFDDAVLALSRLNATRLVVRFQDGTLVDTDLADTLPPVCDLSVAAGSEAVDVVVALPLLSAGGGNLDNGQDSERPRRWKAERVVVQELAGHESGELAILRHALTLRLSSQENTAYLTCPVARLVRNAQGQWSRDPAFIPPMMSVAASPWLTTELNDLLVRLQARRKRLMSMRRESNERMADFAVADVSLFWLLNALNSAEPVLTELLQTPSRHPELLYRELTRLPQVLITQTQQQLARLGKLPPDWNIEYSRQLLEQVRVLWPEQAKPLILQWQQQLNAAALPTEQLNGWFQGMATLQKLSDRLNALDVQKGKYLTVSELKSVVFSAMQSFNQSIPAEEQLRVLSQNPAGEPLPAAVRAQLEMHLKQLIARYAEIKQDSLK
ncbi:type VI secretion system baseplate subunit TssK [Pantoea agglomerans]|uniref:type VI secretion system baseplate subunit TssK n=1 Tax=Enterobacter agglomerans TaxID=549 RepID=UPI003208B274